MPFFLIALLFLGTPAQATEQDDLRAECSRYAHSRDADIPAQCVDYLRNPRSTDKKRQ